MDTGADAADTTATIACTECSCRDVIPAEPRAMADDDPCMCGHAIAAHVGACPGCGAEVRGLDVACRHCGALLGDEIERESLERRNGLAIAAFAIGLLVPVASPIALVLGYVALRQVRSRPMQRGEGFAIAAMCLGGFWLLVIVAGLLFGW